MPYQARALTDQDFTAFALTVAHGPTVYARPYLDAMYSLTDISDYYGLDSAEEIVLRFLSNAGTWRGETARRVKAELKAMVK